MTKNLAWKVGLLPLAVLVVGCGNNPVSPGDSTDVAGTTGTAGAPALGDPWLFFDSRRGLNRDIYAIRSDGKSLKRITTATAIEREPAVSPDGKTLAFASDQQGVFQVYLMDLPAGAPRKLTAVSAGTAQPAWSPDGKTLVFTAGTELWSVGADGQGARMIAGGIREPNADGHPSFAPDGKAIYFDRYNQIVWLDVASGGETAVIPGFTGPTQHPSISPDGHWMAYSTMCEQLLNSVWLAARADQPRVCDASGGTRLTTAAEGSSRFPAFSSTGLIAFERDGLHRLGVVNPGAPSKDVTHGEGDDRNPSWAPLGVVLP